MVTTQIKVCYFFVIFALFLSGCAALTKTDPEGDMTSSLFYESYDNTWDAVMLALETVPLDVVKKGDGFIKTGWIDVESEKEFSGILSTKRWKERFRLRVSVTMMPTLGAGTEKFQ